MPASDFHAENRLPCQVFPVRLRLPSQLLTSRLRNDFHAENALGSVEDFQADFLFHARYFLGTEVTSMPAFYYRPRNPKTSMPAFLFHARNTVPVQPLFSTSSEDHKRHAPYKPVLHLLQCVLACIHSNSALMQSRLLYHRLPVLPTLHFDMLLLFNLPMLV
jgi:hypothetical protein